MNKSKITSVICLVLLSFTLLILSVLMINSVEIDTFCIFAVSSTFPFSFAILIASSFFNGKIKFLRYIFIGYASLLLLLSSIVVIIALTTGFSMVEKGTFVPAW